MSGVSFSSSASQRVRGESVMSLAEFVGLPVLGSVGGNALGKVVAGMFSEKVLAAYHAYLRKFEVTSSVSSQVSGGFAAGVAPKSAGGSSVSSSSWRSSASSSSGYCYLRAFKSECRGAMRRVLGASPSVFRLLAQPAAAYTDLRGLRLSAVGSSGAHLSTVGDYDFREVMADLASRAKIAADSDSLWSSLQGKARVKFPSFNCATAIGASLSERLSEVYGCGLGLTVVAGSYEIRCAETNGLKLAVFFQGGDMVGYLPVFSFQPGALLSLDLLVTETSTPGLLCLAAPRVAIHKDEMAEILTWDVGAVVSAAVSVALAGRSQQDAAINLASHLAGFGPEHAFGDICVDTDLPVVVRAG